MIVLDTNVLSELMRLRQAPEVVAWLQQQHAANIFTTTITMAEVLAGIAMLPGGRRRRDLAEGANLMFNREFAQRILPFDRRAAEAYATVLAARKQSGKPIKELDGQIAAITRAYKMKLATRNVRDFVECGIEVVNPWSLSKVCSDYRSIMPS